MAYGGATDVNYGASQFGGAGFIQSQGNVDNGYGSGGSAKKAPSSNQTLRAVTIRQLLKENTAINDGTYTVDGIELHTATILGRVVSMDENSTFVTLLLDDGTSRVEVLRYIDDNASESLQQWKAECCVGAYVRVHGNLRSFDNKTSLQAYSIRRVTDDNERTYHFLQCIFQHVHLRKGAGPPPAYTGGQPLSAQKTVPAAGAFGTGATLAYGGQAAGGTSNLNDAVMAFYNSPDIAARQEGTSVDEAEKALRLKGINFTRKALKDALDFLCNEGHLYTTVDENSFRTCSSNDN